MRAIITITEQNIRDLIIKELEEKTGQTFVAENLQIEVKSKQNFKSEWEVAAFRATYMGEL